MIGRRSVFAVAAAVLLAGQGCAAAGSNGSPGEAAGTPASPTRDSGREPAGGDVNDLAERVERVALQRFPDRYAGLEISGDRLVLYRKPSPQLDAAVRALSGEARLVLRDAPYSARELQRVRDDVLADADHWRRRGIVISSVAVKHDGTAVEVGTANVERARRELSQRYGATAPLEVVAAGPIVLGPR